MIFQAHVFVCFFSSSHFEECKYIVLSCLVQLKIYALIFYLNSIFEAQQDESGEMERTQLSTEYFCTTNKYCLHDYSSI